MLINGRKKTKKLDQQKTLIEKIGAFDELEAANREAYTDSQSGEVFVTGDVNGRVQWESLRLCRN